MISEWIRLALTGPVVRRAFAYAVVVGAILIAINHGDSIVRADVESGQLVKMALTVCVPYVVSTLSSVGALLESSRRDGSRGMPLD
jgi:hypothetical protein